MKYNNRLLDKPITKYEDLYISPEMEEGFVLSGRKQIIQAVVNFAQQWRANKDLINSNLIRQTAKGGFLAEYLRADKINLSGLPEETQALLGVALRVIPPLVYTPETFDTVRKLLKSIGFYIFVDRENTLVYSLLKQENKSAQIAKNVGLSIRETAGKVKIYINPSDDKEIMLFDGLKGLSETVVAISIIDVFPWLFNNPNVDLGKRAEFGFSFFKDSKTQNKSIWIGNFQQNAARSSLVSEDGKNWTPVAEDQILNQIVDSGYKSFANVTKPDGDYLIPLMVGGMYPNGNTSDIYSRETRYEMASPYSFIKIHTGEFSPRKHLGSVWFDDHLWVVGGLGNDIADCADIWKSPMTETNKTFTLVDDTPPWSFQDDTDKDVYGHSLVVFKDKMWFLGGKKTTNTFYNAVFYSTDGVHWEREVEPPWSPRAFFGCVAIAGRMYVIGGEFYDKTTFSTTVFNDVWYTEDGKNWFEEKGVEFEARSRFGCLADEEKKKIYVSGGQNADGIEYSDFWEHFILQ